MGTWATVVILKSVPERSPLNAPGAPLSWSLGAKGHWLFYELKKRSIGAERLESYATLWSKSTKGPLIAYFVRDSDFAYVTGAVNGRIHFRIVINRDVVDYSTRKRDPLSQLMAQGPAAAERGAEDAAAWSVNAPKRVDSLRLAKILKTNWTFAETGVGRLLAAMGLRFPVEPDEAERFEGALQMMGDAVFDIDGSRVDSRDLRYVGGTGDGFFGIWDRHAPSLKVASFDLSEDGWRQATEKWYSLEAEHRRANPPEQEPEEPDPGRVEAEHFGQAFYMLNDCQIRLGNRMVYADEAQYVIGFGQDNSGNFIGIWDRQAPNTAVVNQSVDVNGDSFIQLQEEDFEAIEDTWRELEQAPQEPPPNASR